MESVPTASRGGGGVGERPIYISIPYAGTPAPRYFRCGMTDRPVTMAQYIHGVFEQFVLE